MRNWFKRAWNKTKAWFLGVLAALGLVVVVPTAAVTTSFTYTPATEYTDATPMPLAEIQSTNLYCDGVLVVSEPGADGTFDPDMVPGTYSCYATHVDIYGRESIPSNTVQKTVLPGLPNPPVLD